MVADRVGGQEHFRPAAAVREVGTAAEARRQNPSEGAAAGIHSGELLIAGGMESGYGRRAALNFAHKLFVLKSVLARLDSGKLRVPDRNRYIRTLRTVS